MYVYIYIYMCTCEFSWLHTSLLICEFTQLSIWPKDMDLVLPNRRPWRRHPYQSHLQQILKCPQGCGPLSDVEACWCTCNMSYGRELEASTTTAQRARKESVQRETWFMTDVDVNTLETSSLHWISLREYATSALTLSFLQKKISASPAFNWPKEWDTRSPGTDQLQACKKHQYIRSPRAWAYPLQGLEVLFILKKLSLPSKLCPGVDLAQHEPHKILRCCLNQW